MSRKGGAIFMFPFAWFHQAAALLRSISRATASWVRASMSSIGIASFAASISAIVLSSCDTRDSISCRWLCTEARILVFSDWAVCSRVARDV